MVGLKLSRTRALGCPKAWRGKINRWRGCCPAASSASNVNTRPIQPGGWNPPQVPRYLLEPFLAPEKHFANYYHDYSQQFLYIQADFTLSRVANDAKSY